jgi:hypothetical protein
MRIERVVAGTFNEASERSRRLYGPDVLLISSSRVGNAHELLVCTDASSNDERVLDDVEARGTFAATMQEEMLARPKAPPVEPIIADPEPQTITRAVDPENGAALVSLIRKELLDLERRIVSNNGGVHGLREKMALLEQGFSAGYAGRLVEAGLSSTAMATCLLDDLNLGGPEIGIAGRPAVFVGPAAGGKTTAAMQAARSIANKKGSPAVVSASRDARPGAREKFFAMADAARIESSWGGVAPGALVVDAGGYNREDLSIDRPELSSYDLYLCMPAYLNRITAARWFDSVKSVTGVILTHWSSAEVPLGLLGCMAERGLRLAGLSASADPTASLVDPTVESFGGPVRVALELTLDLSPAGVE